MMQLLFIDLEQKIKDYEFSGNYEFIGDVLGGDVLTEEIDLLDKLSIELDVTPISEFIDTGKRNNDTLSINELWFAPEEGLKTLDALVAQLSSQQYTSLNKLTARQMRELLEDAKGGVLIEELETLQAHISTAANLSRGVRFKIAMS